MRQLKFKIFEHNDPKELNKRVNGWLDGKSIEIESKNVGASAAGKSYNTQMYVSIWYYDATNIDKLT